jgi:outer membrane immunogenic protein
LAVGIFPTTPFIAPGTSTFSASKTNVGFTLGGGVEGRLSANWTWKLEYLYLDLGSLDTPGLFPATILGQGINTPLAGRMPLHTHFTDNIVRVGLNYKY